MYVYIYIYVNISPASARCAGLEVRPFDPPSLEGNDMAGGKSSACLPVTFHAGCSSHPRISERDVSF